MPAYFVAGATGSQGGPVARKLLAGGHQVRTLVRDSSSRAAQDLVSRGATVVQGSYDDAHTVRHAVGTSVGLFLVLPIDPNDLACTLHTTITTAVLDAADAAGTVAHVVVSTAFWTGRHADFLARDPHYPLKWYYEAKHAVEAAVRARARAYTILRPAWLMHNYLAPATPLHFPELPANHVLASAYRPAARMPHFDAENVGDFAVAAFARPAEFAGREIELGFENLTVADVAREITGASGVDIAVRYRDGDEAKRMEGVVATQGFHWLANEFDLTVPAGSLDEYRVPLTTFRRFLERERPLLRETLGV